MAAPARRSGLGWGTAWVGGVLAVAVLGCIAFMAVTGRDKPTPDGAVVPREGHGVPSSVGVSRVNVVDGSGETQSAPSASASRRARARPIPWPEPVRGEAGEQLVAGDGDPGACRPRRLPARSRVAHGDGDAPRPWVRALSRSTASIWRTAAADARDCGT